jgi:hypothetical protein
LFDSRRPRDHVNPTDKIFPDKSFRQPPDCPTVGFSQTGLMSMRGEPIVTPQDKLDVLQRLDGRWPSLKDRICCTRCGKIFTAGDIAVLGGSRGFGPLRLHCPTEACNATAADWVSAARNFLLPYSPVRQTGKVLTSHNGKVVRVRRAKLARQKEKLEATAIRSFSVFVDATLYRLNRGWRHLWRHTKKLGYR